MTVTITRQRTAGSLLIALLVAIAAAATVFFTLSASADSNSGKVRDAKNDALSATESAHNVDPGTPTDEARKYLDIKSVEVKKNERKNQYVFEMKVAGKIPQNLSGETCYGLVGEPFNRTTVLVNPPDPGACFFAWNWDLDDDGDPFNGSLNLAPTVRWINGAFQGVMFTDAAPVFFDNFTVKGKKLTAVLDADEIESRTDVSDGVFFAGVSRNHRVDFGGDPLVGVADLTDIGEWSPPESDDDED